MGDVLQFPGAAEIEPHLSGECFCMECGSIFDAVAPVGVTTLECPECHTMKGVWRYAVEPMEPYWQCVCGSFLFFNLESGAQCYKCGKLHSYDNIGSS